MADDCKFEPNDWPYGWEPRPRRFWNQQRCPICGLWTVWLDKRFGWSVSMCDGYKAARKAYADINKRAKAIQTH